MCRRGVCGASVVMSVLGVFEGVGRSVVMSVLGVFEGVSRSVVEAGVDNGTIFFVAEEQRRNKHFFNQ